MKKIIFTLCILFLIVTFAGCAVPDKTRIRPPQPPPPAKTVPAPPPQDVPEPEVAPPPEIAGPQGEFERPEDQGGEAELTALMALVNDRIFAYGTKLERWKELDSQAVTSPISDADAAQMVRCFRRLQEMLGGYDTLRTELQRRLNQAPSAKDRDALAQLQQKDIEFLETACGLHLADRERDVEITVEVEDGTDLLGMERTIEGHFMAQEYEQVIQFWSQLDDGQHGRVHLATRMQVASALLALHQDEKAAEVYLRLVQHLSASQEQPTDLLSLRKRLADLYIASGRYGAAALQYQQIVDDYQNLGRLEESAKIHLSILERSPEESQELKDYGAILKNHLGYLAQRDGFTVFWQVERFLTNYPYSPVAPTVDAIREQNLLAAEEWFRAFFAEVDQLAGEKRYAEALKLLATMPADIIGTEQQLAVQEKNDALLLAEAVGRETEKMTLLQDLQNRWNNGMLLAKSGRYDEAIVVFSELLDSDFGPRAAAKIDELALEAAKTERKNAADLFVRYTKTTDIESRKKLLIETRRVLKAIPEKYPNVEIIPKVIDNIKRVEEEMFSIDPALVSMADALEPTERVDGVDQIFAPAGPAGAGQTSQGTGIQTFNPVQ